MDGMIILSKEQLKEVLSEVLDEKLSSVVSKKPPFVTPAEIAQYLSEHGGKNVSISSVMREAFRKKHGLMFMQYVSKKRLLGLRAHFDEYKAGKMFYETPEQTTLIQESDNALKKRVLQNP